MFVHYVKISGPKPSARAAQLSTLALILMVTIFDIASTPTPEQNEFHKFPPMTSKMWAVR
jgi:hypothetical protein